jgi:hypothetical protein
VNKRRRCDRQVKKDSAHDRAIRALVGTPWKPPADSDRKIDTSRRMTFPRNVEEKDISALEEAIGLSVPPERRKHLRDGLNVAFTVLAVGRHSANAAQPHEIRDRMEQVRDAAHRLLEHLGVTPTDAMSEKWEPTGINFNETVFAALVDAANDDRALIRSATRAIGAIARFADLARVNAEEMIRKKKSGTSRRNRLACAQTLAVIFVETLGQEPTETTNGPWEKFAVWAFDFAGDPITHNAARDLLRAAKRSPLTLPATSV